MPLFIMDVADVTFTRKSDNHVVFTSEAQTSTLSQTVDEETIKGGIGSRSIYTIKSNKELELSVRNATFDLEWLAMTQGVAVKDADTLVVQKKFSGTVASGGLTIEGVPAGSVYILNEDRESKETTVAEGGVVTIPPTFAEDGEDVQVIVEEEVIGKSVKMRSDRFAEKYKVQYQTIVYDAKTEAVVADLYIVFNEVSPSSAFDMSLENGTAYTPELTFRATSNEGGEIGTWMLVDRD